MTASKSDSPLISASHGVALSKERVGVLASSQRRRFAEHHHLAPKQALRRAFAERASATRPTN